MTRNEALAILRPEDPSESALKSAYRASCLLHHPDKGGDAEIMKLVNLAYELLKKLSYCAEDIKQGNRSQPLTEKIKPIWDRIKTMPGISGEIIGSWLWIKGDTFKYRSLLKEMGFQWSKDKKAWYWHSKEDVFKKKSKKVQSWDNIRAYFGSFDLDNEPANAIG